MRRLTELVECAFTQLVDSSVIGSIGSFVGAQLSQRANRSQGRAANSSHYSITPQGWQIAQYGRDGLIRARERLILQRPRPPHGVLDKAIRRAIIALLYLRLSKERLSTMASLLQLDESNFEQEVINEDSLPVLVDFFAEWCPPCRRLGPTLESLAEDLDGQLKVVKVNVDKSNIATSFGVMNIPTMILFKNGEEVKRIVGNQAKQALVKHVEPYL